MCLAAELEPGCFYNYHKVERKSHDKIWRYVRGLICECGLHGDCMRNYDMYNLFARNHGASVRENDSEVHMIGRLRKELVGTLMDKSIRQFYTDN
jgi:hypothetical protein